MTELTQERLKHLLNYDPETGIFTWLVRRGGKAQIGSKAGRVNVQKHRMNYKVVLIKVDGKIYSAGQLAYLYMTGSFVDYVDHRNRNALDNRWLNLRPCSQSCNQANRSKSSNNSTGFKGVYHSKGKWFSAIGFQGKQIRIGTYKTKEEAAEAYRAKAVELFGEFANW